MRPGAALAILLTAACHRASGSAPAPTRCEPGVPPTAQHPIGTKARDLAGDYDLIQVQTQPVAGLVGTGRLRLAPLDSAARAGAVGGTARDLVGWLEPVRRDRATWANATSRDPNQPGALLAGDHLVLGDIGVTDGYTERLTITAVAPEGFWGWWQAHPGLEMITDSAARRVLPDAAGYFCALRARP